MDYHGCARAILGLGCILTVSGTTEGGKFPDIKVISPETNETIISDLQEYVHTYPNEFFVSCNASYPVSWNYSTTTSELPETIIRYRHHSSRSTRVKISEAILEIKNPVENNQGFLTCYNVNDPRIRKTFFLFIHATKSVFSTVLLEDTTQVIRITRDQKRVTLPCLLDRSINDSVEHLALFNRGKEIHGATYVMHQGFQIDAPAPKPMTNVKLVRETYECRLFHKGRTRDISNRNLRIFSIMLETASAASFEPSIPKIYVNQSAVALQLSCQVKNAGNQLDIVQWRPYKTLENLPKIKMLAAGSAKVVLKQEDISSDKVFACVKHDDSGNSTATEILHLWRMEKSDQVELKSYTDDSRRTIRCEAWNSSNSINLGMRIARCTTMQQCSWISHFHGLKVAAEADIHKASNTYDTLGRNGITYSSWDGSIRVSRCPCYQVQSVQTGDEIPCDCFEYSIKHTGLVQCSYDPRGLQRICDPLRESEDLATLTSFVQSGYRSPPDDVNECIADGLGWPKESGLPHANEPLYFKGLCALALQANETYRIKCVGLQGKYAENFIWKVQNKTMMTGTNESFHSYHFKVLETRDQAMITSELIIETGRTSPKPQTFAIECSAHLALAERTETINTTVKFKVRVANGFHSCNVSETCSADTVKSLECSIGDRCEVKCSKDFQSFPLPNFQWSRLEKSCDRNTSFARMRSTIRVDRDTLTFSNFQQVHTGTYVCMGVVKSKDINGTEQSFCREEHIRIDVEDSSKNLIIALGVIIPLCVLACCAAVFYNIRFKQERFRANMLSDREVYEFINGNKSAINDELDLSEQAHLLPYENSYEYPYEKLLIGKQLGAGAYGTVVRAEAADILQDGVTTTVAVKTVHPNADLTYFKALLKELKVMIHIGSHLNVVNLLGACTVDLKHKKIYIIVEFCCYGNLQHYMHKYRKKFVNQVVNEEIDPNIRPSEVEYANLVLSPDQSSVTLNSGGSSAAYQNTDSSGTFMDTGGSSQPLWRSNVQGDFADCDQLVMTTTTLISWCYQIAKGMEYLALKRVFHGDLAARNVLLAEGGVVKVADFGLARQVYQDVNYVKKEKCPLPVKWMALESLLRLEFSSQSDVWSYGILLWEIFTLGHVPYPGVEVDSNFVTALQSGTRLDKPTYTTIKIYSMMRKCWEEEPSARPDFSSLGEFFRDVLQSSDAANYENVILLQEKSRNSSRKTSEVRYQNVPSRGSAKKKISFE